MTVLTHALRKDIQALHRKKGRLEQGCFLVEGVKCVQEALQSGWEIRAVLSTEAWTPADPVRGEWIQVSDAELQKLSALEHAQAVIAVVRIPAEPAFAIPQGRVLALDGLQDPGNFGTILRLADWFGLEALVCSADCVDRFNPKVVQASMGSLFRVPVLRTDLAAWLRDLPDSVWCGGAFLDGENVYAAGVPVPGVLVLGNEGNGIRPETEAVLRHRVTIPGRGGAESLNVASAAAVFCSEWTRAGFCAMRPQKYL